MSVRTPPTFIFAGGGTGGHLYPSLAIAQQVAKLAPDARFHYLCSDREIDRKVLEPEGVKFTPLPAKPIGVRPRALWRFVSNWPGSVRVTRAAIKAAREETDGGEVQLIALGGFVAAPAVQAARVENAAVTLVNIDATPGKANRWIDKRCSPGGTFTTYASPAHPHWKVINPIVRTAAAASLGKEESRRRLGLDEHRPVLMITGGSLGAQSVNKMMTALAESQPEAFKARGWQVLHQYGKDENDDIAAAYAKAGIKAVAVPFTREMGLWWGAADLAVSRAGAGTVAEVWCNRVPCVFLPYPYHNDDHQRHNAQILADRGAAVICTDHKDVAKNLSEAGAAIARMLGDSAELARLSAGSVGLPPADGAAVVAGFLTRNRA